MIDGGNSRPVTVSPSAQSHVDVLVHSGRWLSGTRSFCEQGATPGGTRQLLVDEHGRDALAAAAQGAQEVQPEGGVGIDVGATAEGDQLGDVVEAEAAGLVAQRS